MKALLLLGTLFALAGPGPNDPQDSVPAWSSDGVHVAFERQIGDREHVDQMTSAGKGLYVAAQTGLLRGWVPKRNWLLIQPSDTETIATAGGRYAGPIAIFHGDDASASPDGTHVAYLRDGTLYVARIDAMSATPVYPVPVPPEQAIATGVDPPSWDITGPAWSPDGMRIAIASGSSLLLVNADGSGSHVLYNGSNQNVDPSWSHDGETIAFASNDGPHWSIREIGANGSNPRTLTGAYDARFPRFSPVSGALAYISDQQHVPGGATTYQYALYRLDPGRPSAQKLVDDVHPDSPPAWSPTAALIAVAAGQECRRWGIYVVRSEGGTPRRHSNICRFTGTSGDDVLRGSYFFDLIRGLGGNDRIVAHDGNDRIEGNAGDDTIDGGAGNDVIFPGPGRDRVDCGPGVDTVIGAGPFDRIAKSCEHVQRR